MGGANAPPIRGVMRNYDNWGKCPVCDKERKTVNGGMKKHRRYVAIPEAIRLPTEPYGEMVHCYGSHRRPIKDVVLGI